MIALGAIFFLSGLLAGLAGLKILILDSDPWGLVVLLGSAVAIAAGALLINLDDEDDEPWEPEEYEDE